MTGETVAPTTTANVESVAPQGTVQADVADPNTKPSEGGDGGTPEQKPNDDTTKPVDEVKPDEGEAKPDDKVDEGAPEEYADFTVPEGMVLDVEQANAFKEVAKAANLSQASAQQMIDLASKQVEKTLLGFQEQATERVAQWAEQAKADPEVGGPKYAENVQVALAAVTKFGDAELKQAFEEFGLGNHPAFVRAFYRIGKAMGESGFVHRTGNEQPAKSGNREAALAQRIADEQARNPAGKGPRDK